MYLSGLQRPLDFIKKGWGNGEVKRRGSCISARKRTSVHFAVADGKKDGEIPLKGRVWVGNNVRCCILKRFARTDRRSGVNERSLSA
jgi:hypothetical protein